MKDAVVLDVGGTTSDIGVLVDGFPRESSLAVDVGGVRTNFRMPDIVSIGVGGGSLVREQPDGSVTVGPIVSATVLHKRPLFWRHTINDH